MGGYPADPICGLQMIACTLAALYRRLRTGVGAHVDGSMMEAATGYIADALLAQALADAGAEVEHHPAHTTLTPAASTWDALAGPRLAGWFIPLVSPGLGEGKHAGRLWRFAEAALPAATPPPRLGQHTRAILADRLGPEDAERLIADGVAGFLD